MLKRILLIVGIISGIVLNAADYRKELDEIKAGKRTEAIASWWGFDKEDATRCLQQAIDSGVKKRLFCAL